MYIHMVSAMGNLSAHLEGKVR